MSKVIETSTDPEKKFDDKLDFDKVLKRKSKLNKKKSESKDPDYDLRLLYGLEPMNISREEFEKVVNKVSIDRKKNTKKKRKKEMRKESKVITSIGNTKLNVLGVSFEANSIINTEYGDRVFNKRELEKDFAEIAKHIESLEWMIIGEHRRGRFDKSVKSKNKISITGTFTDKTTLFNNICAKIEMMKDMRAHIIGVIIDKNKEPKVCDLTLHSLISKGNLKELKFKVRSLGFFIPLNIVSDDVISKYILNEELKKIYGKSIHPVSLNRSDEPAKEDPDSKITDDEICFMRFILNGINDENNNLFPIVDTHYSIKKCDITDESIGCVSKMHVYLTPEISYDRIKDFALNTIGFSSFPSEEEIIKKLNSDGLLKNPYKVSMTINRKEHMFYRFKIDDVIRVGSMHLKVKYKKEDCN